MTNIVWNLAPKELVVIKQNAGTYYTSNKPLQGKLFPFRADTFQKGIK